MRQELQKQTRYYHFLAIHFHRMKSILNPKLLFLPLKNIIDLASHIRVHEDVRKYMCDVCGKRFRSQSHMTYHRYAHFDERNFACDQCPQAFKSPHILRTHKNTVHSSVYKYECEQCGRKFKRDHHLVVCRFIDFFYAYRTL